MGFGGNQELALGWVAKRKVPQIPFGVKRASLAVPLVIPRRSQTRVSSLTAWGIAWRHTAVPSARVRLAARSITPRTVVARYEYVPCAVPAVSGLAKSESLKAGIDSTPSIFQLALPRKSANASRDSGKHRGRSGRRRGNRALAPLPYRRLPTLRLTRRPRNDAGGLQPQALSSPSG